MQKELIKIAALYIRVSTDEQAKEGYSIPAQTDILTQYCKAFGIKIFNTYTDPGASGKNITRPGLQQMMRDAKRGLFNCLVVWKISRLSRSLKDLLTIVDDLENNGVSFISHSEHFDTSTPVGRMTLQVLGSIAEFERNTMIENVKLGLKERAKQGKWTGNHVFGYDNKNKELIINDFEAAIVRRIYDMYLKDDKGLFTIASTLNTEGLKTKRKSMFGKDYIERILKNTVYIGKVRHNIRNDQGYYEVDGIHQPVITIDEYNQAQIKLKKSSIRFQKDPNSFLLISLIKCKACGNNMISKYGYYNSKKYRYYICGRYHRLGKAACSPNPVQADDIENEALERLFRIIENPETISNIISKAKKRNTSCLDPVQKELRSINIEIEKNDRNLQKYFKLFENDRLKPDILEARITEIHESNNKLSERKFELEKFLRNNTDTLISEEEVLFNLKQFNAIFASSEHIDKRILLQSFIDEIRLTSEGKLDKIITKFPIGTENIEF